MPETMKERFREGKPVAVSEIKKAARPAHAKERHAELTLEEGIARVKAPKESFKNAAELMQIWTNVFGAMLTLNASNKVDPTFVLDALAYQAQLCRHLLELTPEAVAALDTEHRCNSDEYTSTTRLANINNSLLSRYLYAPDNRLRNTFCATCNVVKIYCTCSNQQKGGKGGKGGNDTEAKRRCNRFNRSQCKVDNCPYTHECNHAKCKSRTTHPGHKHEAAKHE